MPFTFSHPAIILPLSYLPRRWYSLTGLVIGSMTPDFEYFIRMKAQSEYSHSLLGLFWFDLPLGVLLTFIFHGIVRDGLLNNLPGFIRARVARFQQFDYFRYWRSNWYVVLLSLLFGSLSHIAWDNTTHHHGHLAGFVPELLTVVHVLGREVTIVRLFQIASSLIGGLVVAGWILNLPADRDAEGSINWKYWLAVISLTACIVMIRFSGGYHPKFFGHLVVTTISAVLISLIVTPLFLSFVERGRQ